MKEKRRTKKVVYLLVGVIWFIYSFDCSLYAQDEVLEAAGGTLEFSIDEISRIALENNLDIQMAKLDLYIEQEGNQIAQSIFDTFFTFYGSYLNDRKDTPSAVLGSENMTRIFGGKVAKKLPTGTDVEIDVYHQKNYTDSMFATLNPAHEAMAKVSLRQPLGKNFFGLRDRGEIKLTKLDIENFKWTSLSDIELHLAQVQEAYWRLVLAFNELEVRREMLKRAKRLYGAYEDKSEIGLAEEPAVVASRANVKVRESELLIAKLKVTEAQNNLLFLISEDDLTVTIKPKDSLMGEVHLYDFYRQMSEAVEGRRDYRRAKNMGERNKIDLAIKKNALWPQIDLEASFARNGIDTDPGDAWSEFNSEKHPEIFVGVTISTPLEMRKEKAQRNQAELEKEKYILFLKQIEHLIFKEINTIVASVNTYALEVETNEELVALQEAKLSAEEEILHYGRSSIDAIIRYQEDVLTAKLNFIHSLFNYRIAVINLETAKNSLLGRYWKDEL